MFAKKAATISEELVFALATLREVARISVNMVLDGQEAQSTRNGGADQPRQRKRDTYTRTKRPSGYLAYCKLLTQALPAQFIITELNTYSPHAG